MRYLITTNEENSPFLTNWFNAENNYNAEAEMVVYDLVEQKFTSDGETWNEIEIDHL